MAPLVNWQDTLEIGLHVEGSVAEEFGLCRNPDVTGTDLYHSDSGVYIEIKSIGSKAIEYTTAVDGSLVPKYMYFQLTRKAHLNDENNWFPVIRPGSVFRTCIDTPNSLVVVRCPEKKFYDYWTSRSVTIPQTTYYYNSWKLALKLLSLMYTKEVTVHRLYHKDASHGFETVVKVELSHLRDIELTRAAFVDAVSQQSEGGMTSEVAKEVWMDAVNKFTLPCLRKVEMYKNTFDALLSLDRDPVWRPSWWRPQLQL